MMYICVNSREGINDPGCTCIFK